MSRSKSSSRWLEEHRRDGYVRAARASGYRSRAAYKLLDIQARDALMRPGMMVVDLGAAPGGWSQVAAGLIGPHGRVIALDVAAMKPLPGVESIVADFTEPEARCALDRALGGAQVDLVLSDMAPNMSGIKVVDQARASGLCELAVDFAVNTLAPGGAVLMKAFEGAGLDEIRTRLHGSFARVQVRKPAASRDRSRELYLLARGYTR